ncbi:MAG: FlgO family outer membrane protein [Thermodesulfobacteriota bacterium]|nr:FlgO family outer membrane protein [Thermodesulfobacteriota bacterium]
MPRKILIFVLLALFMAAPVKAKEMTPVKSIPDTATEIAASLDAQLTAQLGLVEGPAKGTSLIITTPVSLNDLERSSPLARLLAEEMAAWFVQAGYKVREIRKGKNILFDPKNGELLLSRHVEFIHQGFVKSALVLTGTYTMTTKNVRFNVRLVSAPGNEVLAMGCQTLPLSPEIMDLVDKEQLAKMTKIRPSVQTRIPGI